ncbi:hypothetical protein ACHAXA_005776 [Cyclostephanos tholiformis]|uniref:Uncharacterized protein n=1 Tax=Cyclostephanos tholiformis TaxID=382380 RepID=A0ABD3RSP8_9STRA
MTTPASLPPIPTTREYRAMSIEKIRNLILSLIIAVALLYATIVILAHTFVATAPLYLRPPATAAAIHPRPTTDGPSHDGPTDRAAGGGGEEGTMIPPGVETVIMYVPPTREDLDRIRLELELDIEEEDDDAFAAAVRVSNDDDDEEERRRYAEDLVRAIVSSNESLLRRRERERERRREDMRALSEAHASFDMARESDLYVLVEDIKRDVMTRRRDHDPYSSVIDGGVLDDIRSTIEPIVSSIEERRRSALAREGLMRESWVGRMEAMRVGSGPIDDDDDDDDGGIGGTVCASTDVVVGMVSGGLEALRRGDDMRSALEDVALAAAAAAGGGDEEILKLRIDMDGVRIPEVDDTETASRPPGRSSGKVGKKSIITHAIDIPMLHRGIVGWIDFFVDAISGYNDDVDSLIDWMVGDDGASAGKTIVTYFSKLVKKVPF